MNYIHTLSDLSPRSAEIESVLLIRDLRYKTSFPLNEAQFCDYISGFFISGIDIDAISRAIELVPSIIEDISKRPATVTYEDPLHVGRANAALAEIPDALANNLNYMKEIYAWQQEALPELVSLLNKIPLLKEEEKPGYDEKITAIFTRLLRNSRDFKFSTEGMITEVHLSMIRNLAASMEKEVINDTKKKVTELKNAVERAYDNNLRMVSLAVALYAYVKMFSSLANK